MHLRVLGKPENKQPKASQRIHTSYNPVTELTSVTCDADVITLGITLSVLKGLFNEALSKLDAETANEIRVVTERAALNNEEYRD